MLQPEILKRRIAQVAQFEKSYESMARSLKTARKILEQAKARLDRDCPGWDRGRRRGAAKVTAINEERV